MSNSAWKGKKRGEKGIALLITAVSLMCIIPIVGLAIDSGYAYVVKAKLAAASDAAALAAAMALRGDLTIAEQTASAQARALTFFNANFPQHYMNTSVVRLTTSDVTVVESSYRTRTVTVSPMVTLNTWFMRFLGPSYKTMDIRAIGQASRRDVNIILILDRSGSMQTSGSCAPMVSAATQFVNMFADGRDRIGMVSFGASWLLAFAPSQTFLSSAPSLPTQIGKLKCFGNTSTAMALSEAYKQIQLINEPGTLNIIVFFTDGLPNGITATFPVKTQTDNRYGYGTSPYTSTSTSYSMAPSTCKDGASKAYPTAGWAPVARLGVLAQGSSYSTYGYTTGLYEPAQPSITSSTEPIINGAVGTNKDYRGCAFATSSNYVRRDIAYIPNADYYNNSTTSGYKTVTKFASGAYSGFIRPDQPSVFGAAAANAAWNAANKIRSDTTLKPLIVTIGLGDPTGAEPPDLVLLQQMANVNGTTGLPYDSSQPTGIYAYAPDKSQLSKAFNKVASEILRIAK
jgi:hypothetical protein